MLMTNSLGTAVEKKSGMKNVQCYFHIRYFVASPVSSSTGRVGVGQRPSPIFSNIMITKSYSTLYKDK